MISSTPRRVLVTGMSRRRGIGFAIARRLLTDGAGVFAQSWTPHDAGQPWVPTPRRNRRRASRARRDQRTDGARQYDLEQPEAPGELVAEAARRFGTLDTLVVNHARGSSAGSASSMPTSWIGAGR